jgi:hypothetical protein
MPMTLHVGRVGRKRKAKTSVAAVVLRILTAYVSHSGSPAVEQITAHKEVP